MTASSSPLRRAALVAAAAAALAAAGGASWFGGFLHKPYAGWPGENVVVTLESGLDAGSMLRRLARAGVVRRPAWIRGWLTLRGTGSDLRAGEYRFDRPLSPLDVLERLRAGDVLLHPVTLPEGLTMDEIALRVAQAGLGEPAALRRAFRDPAPIRAMDPDADDLEGYLFPDTYHFPKGEPPDSIARTFVARFIEVVGPDYPARARAAGLDLRGAVTLASLIEKETSVPNERSRISRVFHNRLERRMRLECDPTVIYALRRQGKTVDVLTREDLRVDSPWNTYRVHGLPPSPIANPGAAALEAAVAPEDGPELYFVAAPEGGHRFSETLAQHQRAVADWRRYVRSSR